MNTGNLNLTIKEFFSKIYLTEKKLIYQLFSFIIEQVVLKL